MSLSLSVILMAFMVLSYTTERTIGNCCGGGCGCDSRNDCQSNSEMNQLKERVSMLENSLRISFTACAVTHTIYRSGNQIMFPHTSFNYGDHYKTSTSKFLCPVSGIYQFEIHVLNQAAAPAVTARIMKTGWTKGRSEVYAGSSTLFNQGSNSVITQCNMNEEVWVITGPHTSSNPVYGTESGDENRCMSSFSGKLLAVMESEVGGNVNI